MDIGNSKWVSPDIFHFVDENIPQTPAPRIGDLPLHHYDPTPATEKKEEPAEETEKTEEKPKAEEKAKTEEKPKTEEKEEAKPKSEEKPKEEKAVPEELEKDETKKSLV